MTKHKTFLFIFIGIIGFLVLLIAMNMSNIKSDAKIKAEESNAELENNIDLNGYLNNLEKDTWLSYDFVPDQIAVLDFKDNGEQVAYSVNDEQGTVLNYEVVDLLDETYGTIKILDSNIPDFSGEYVFSLNNGYLHVFDLNNNLLGEFETLSMANATLNNSTN